MRVSSPVKSVFLAACLLPLPGGAGVAPLNIQVNLESDAVDVNPGDGLCDSDGVTEGLQCTLRAAVMEANAFLGFADDTITLPAGTFTLDLKNQGADDEMATAGDLDITQAVTIQGAGPADTVIDGKKAKDRIFDTYADLTLIGVTLTGGKASDKNEPNQADAGGGGCVRGRADLTIDTVNVVKCKAGQDGGGLLQLTGTLIAIDTLFQSNSAKEDGGGVALEPAATTIEGSAFVKNKSKDEGGGLAIDGGIVDVVNTTFSGNKAKEEGGGVLNEEGGNLDLVHVTFFNNKAKLGDSVHVNDTLNPPTTSATNSIFFSKRKRGANNCRQSLLTAITSLGGNIDNGSSCEFMEATDLSETDPLLEKRPEDNGGPTPTHALDPMSDAIDITDDAGTCESDDQRGEPRGTFCDSGAFEL